MFASAIMRSSEATVSGESGTVRKISKWLGPSNSTWRLLLRLMLVSADGYAASQPFDLSGLGHLRCELELAGVGLVRANAWGAFGVLASRHEQSVPIFQQLARGHPSSRDDVRAVPAVFA